MEHRNMFDNVVKFRQKTILNEFCLKETSFIDWTVEKSIEAHIPEEIWTVLLGEEVL
jgi:hypothetical protein